MNIDKLKKLLSKYDISVSEIIENNKASETYIRTTFVQSDGFKWNTVVPYIDRRAGIHLRTEQELAEYLISIKPFFRKDAMEQWRKQELKRNLIGGSVTPKFFKVLMSFKEEFENFPANPNPARRIQDIKDAGYTIASVPRKNHQKGYNRVLLPLPLHTKMEYETFSPQFKARVIRLLNGRNAFEARTTTPKALIPDHKFSEIRWDSKTKQENPMKMTDEEIIQKFQLLDNQRNQQKREVCRKCFQEGKRGVLYGIPFFYSGNENWSSKIPKTGKQAEKGCVGCAWYDIERWRLELIKLINVRKH